MELYELPKNEYFTLTDADSAIISTKGRLCLGFNETSNKILDGHYIPEPWCMDVHINRGDIIYPGHLFVKLWEEHKLPSGYLAEVFIDGVHTSGFGLYHPASREFIGTGYFVTTNYLEDIMKEFDVFFLWSPTVGKTFNYGKVFVQIGPTTIGLFNVPNACPIDKTQYDCSILMSGRNFVTDIENGCITEYDGMYDTCLIDGYLTNLGVYTIDGTSYFGGFPVKSDNFIGFCKLYKIEVAWYNK